MRVGLLLLLTLGSALIPYALGGRAFSAGPHYLVALALVSLAGTASGMALFIGAMIDPSNLSARDIPEAVGYCVDAAGRFFAHPVDHWPRIIAALILLGFLGRLATATVTTLRDGRRGRLPRGSLPGEAELSRLTFGGPQPGVRIVAHPLPVAYTTGLFLRQIVVSTGLLEGLEPLERDAVIAHEQAHVRGGHNGLMFIGGALAKAFGFFSPVKRAVQQLLLGLESAADDRAVTVIGSRIIVARTIAKLAERSAFCPPAPSLGAVSSNVVLRVRRLAANEPSGGSRVALLGQIIVAFAIAVLVAQGVALSLTSSSGVSSAQQLHSVCHLPHALPPVA